MVILHVTAPGEVGGLESVVLGLARGHRAAGHEVHVGTVVHDANDARSFVAALEAADVRVHPIEVPTRGYRAERACLEAICRRIRPDVVHTHGFRPDVVDAPVAWKLGLPTVTTVHGHNHAGTRERLSEWVQHRAFRRFGAVVAVSRPLVERLRRAGVAGERVHLVRNACRRMDSLLPATEARELLHAPEGAWHAGWVGRVEPVKGPDTFIAAMDLMGDLPLTATMVGDGCLLSALEARSRRMGLGGRVRWLGAVPAASRLFAAFDMLVLSSRMEGTPMVLLEAMAVGLPLVVTEVGGVPDVVTRDEALLVPPEDPAALAEAMRTVVRDPAAASARAQAAVVRLAEHFPESSWLAQYEHIYRLLQSPNEGRLS